ncbi:MAG: hypothetical protein M3325_05960, partial [Actinomycetota bacterium]|nr:hypothetical protein [Actinomycetota bacterium]
LALPVEVAVLALLLPRATAVPLVAWLPVPDPLVMPPLLLLMPPLTPALPPLPAPPLPPLPAPPLPPP